MESLELAKKSEKSLGFKRVKIKDIKNNDDYLYIVLEDGQKLLSVDGNTYNLSEYSYLNKVFKMDNRLCALVVDWHYPYVIDLNTKEVLFEDKYADSDLITKEDDRTLKISVYSIETGYKELIYDIETKRYLPTPEDYEFEHSLGNGLYVFCQLNKKEPFHDRKRLVINIEGKIILKDIYGWIYLSDNHIIVIREKEMDIVGVSETGNVNINTIKENGIVLAKPAYYNGNIVVVEKEMIKIIAPSLETIKQIPISGVVKVLDVDLTEDTYKILVPFNQNGKVVNRHIFVNLKTGKSLSHIRIDGYPYWNPTTYIGYDTVAEDENRDYYFYDENFAFIDKINAQSCVSIGSEKECKFFLESKVEDVPYDFNISRDELYLKRKEAYQAAPRYFINAKTKVSKRIGYDYIDFPPRGKYGYGVNEDSGTMDFVDEDLNVIISNFEYKKENISLRDGNFSFQVVNNYLYIISYFTDEYGQSRYRKIIKSPQGETVLDSLSHKCYVIGNIIQITENGQSEFLNTLTGEIGHLELSVPINENGKIDLSRLTSLSNALTIGENYRSALSAKLEKQVILEIKPK